MSKPTVLLDIKYNAPNKRETFQAILPEQVVVDFGEGAPGEADRAGIRYAVVWKPTHGLLKTLPALEAIFSLGAGVDHVLSDPDLPDVPLVRFVDPDLTGRMVEYVVLQVLLHMRQQRQYDALQRKRTWAELSHPAAKDFCVGIMGFGELGQACARGLAPLGFRLAGWSRSPKTMEGVKSFHGPDGPGGLDGFLGETDILVCLLPYTPQTHGIINAELIDKLSRKGPFKAPVLINAGRGGSQVSADIAAALQDGRLRGASLDVFEEEPLSKDSPLWSLENAVITPHIAAMSDPRALAMHIRTQITRHEKGEALQFVVDPKLGY